MGHANSKLYRPPTGPSFIRHQHVPFHQVHAQPQTMRPAPPFPFTVGVVLCGSLMASSSAIWIRFLPDLSPIVIGFIRVAGATVIFLPWFLREFGRQRPPWHVFRYSVLAGVALALHFATWIASLSYTTVALSVLFVATYPIFVIAISLGILRVPVARNQIIGAGVALSGIVFIQWHSHGADPSGSLLDGQPFGNLLALLGGFLAAVYMLFSQEARKSLSTILHVEVTYATAAVVLLLAVLTLGQPPIPLDPGPWLFLGLLILVPTLGGHTIFNWGVHHLGATLVSLMGLLEPVESALLALIFLGEGLPPHTLLGGIIILGGLTLALWQPLAYRAGSQTAG